MKKITLALCAASAVFAASNYNYEITPFAGLSHYAHENLKDSAFYGMKVARNLDFPWLSQIELGIDQALSVKYKDRTNKGYNQNSYDKTNIGRYYANLVKNFYITDDFAIYALAGGGFQHYTHNDQDSQRGGFGQVGLGLRYDLTNQIAVKLEGRDIIKHGNDKQLISLGFGIGLGQKASAQEVISAPVIGDEDMDGVPDNIDRCPGTPQGQVVDEFGCEKVIRLQLGVYFGFDSAVITPEYEAKIAEVSELLKQNPSYLVLLEGNTDDIGSSQYNLKLSKRRADAVAQVLVKHGIDASRISTTGLGKDNPVASNQTEDGRAKNRRVDAKFRK